MTKQIAPTFNSLNGEELIEVILNDIRQALELTGEFKQHQGFPLVRVRFNVSVNSYPKQTLEEEPKIKTQGEVVLPKGEETPTIEATTVVAEVRDDKVIDTPDLARRKAKIPIKVPAVGANKRIEDVVVPIKESKTPIEAKS